MIVEFSVKNFRSIKDLQTLSFVATGLKSPDEYKNVDVNNIAQEGDLRLLKTVGIYGANGSGKSNIIQALDYFLKAIRTETSNESRLGLLCDPFLYEDDAIDRESFFQIVLMIEEKKYRYGFTVKKNPGIIVRINDDTGSVSISSEIIVSEWLFGQKEKNMVELFTREKGVVNKEKLDNNKAIPDLSVDHNLFLTYAGAFDADGICAVVRRNLTARAICNYTDGYEPFRKNSLRVIELEKRTYEFLQFLSEFNLKYSDIEIDRDPGEGPFEALPHEKITLIKEYEDANHNIRRIRLNLKYNESQGTQKLFDLAGVFLRAFGMKLAGLIIIDEIDSHFHPSLLLRIIRLMNNPNVNKGNIQLVFTSHDTNLLSPEIMRRDQFYFAEKRQDESTRLYSLADLKGIRNDADFAKQYLAGFYGAVPKLEDMLALENRVDIPERPQNKSF
ncbi:AAA family ATPase [Fulvivirgaceae bacterium PWU5]|uniref:AAA family ATPase n=1 Tax=Dawidia cretensis TaxID=2782350 RepID=A0AAP2DYA7_9BACT|nr:ATP-binding protein [Dawidia cretensis]MBT1709450.1 AAA family ATPase [Dawidia cretensis]